RVGQRDPAHLLPHHGRVGGQRARAAVADPERAHHERRAGSAAAHTAVAGRRGDGYVTVHAHMVGDGKPAGRRLRRRHRQRAELPGHRRRPPGPGGQPIRLHGRPRPLGGGHQSLPAGHVLLARAGRSRGRPRSVVGGAPLLGTATLLNPAPPGGVQVTLVNGDSTVITLPPSVFIPAGGTGATFNVATAPVSIPTRVTIDAGTGFEGYRSPGAGLTLLPPGSPPPAPSLAALTLASASVLGGGSTTGTVALTAPAPAGGAAVWVCGSMEGQVVTSPCIPPGVIVPAGSISADFPITAPQVNAP